MQKFNKSEYPNITKAELKQMLIDNGYTDLRYSGKERAFYARRPDENSHM